MCSSITCHNGGTCYNERNYVYCSCTEDYRGLYCEQSKSRQLEPPSSPKPNRLDPWFYCPNNTFCYERFSDKVCNPECNSRECLFDGFDCRDAGDMGGNNGGGGNSNNGAKFNIDILPNGNIHNGPQDTNGRASQCNEMYESYCARNFANGHCDYGCNNAECAWDGLDCEPQPQSEDNLRGELVLNIDMPLLQLNGTYNNANDPPLVKRLLRQLSTIIGSVLQLREMKTNGMHSTRLVLGIDNRKCGVDQCFENVREIASFLNASQDRMITPIKDMFEAYGLRMRVDTIDDEQEIFRRPGSQVPNLTYIVLGIMTLLFVGILLGALVTNNRKKARGVTWFPEGFFSPTTHIGRASSRHHHNASAGAAGGNFGRNLRQGLSYSNSVRSGCPDGQEMRQFKSREDLLDEKSVCAAIYEEPSECRAWSMANMEAYHPQEVLTPPLATPSLDALGPNGMTPLMVAAAYPNSMMMNGQSDGNMDAVEDLLRSGADVNKTCDITNETSLHLAARHARADNAKLFIEYGADVNAQDNTGRTPLHAAIAADAKGVFDILLRNRNSDLNAKTCDGTTPLILAARMEIKDMVEQLLQNNVDVNATDDNEKTALHWVASIDNHEIARMLLMRGAERDPRNKNDETPLFLAAREGAYQTVRLLLDFHANRDITDHMERLPRDVANQRMHSDIVALLDDYKPTVLPPPIIPQSSSSSQAAQNALNLLSPTNSGSSNSPWNQDMKNGNGVNGTATLGRNTMPRRRQTQLPPEPTTLGRSKNKPQQSQSHQQSQSQHFHQHSLSQLSNKIPLPLPPPQSMLLLASANDQSNSLSMNHLNHFGGHNNNEYMSTLDVLGPSQVPLLGHHHFQQQQQQHQPPPVYTSQQHHHQAQLSQSIVSQQAPTPQTPSSQSHHGHHHLHQHSQSFSTQAAQVASPPLSATTTSFYDFSPPPQSSATANNGNSAQQMLMDSSIIITPPSRPPPAYEECFKQQNSHQQQQQQQAHHYQQLQSMQQQPIAAHAPRHNLPSQQSGQQAPPLTPTAHTAPALPNGGQCYQQNGGSMMRNGMQQAQHHQQQQQQQSNNSQQSHRLPESYPTPSPESLSTSSPLSAHDWGMGGCMDSTTTTTTAMGGGNHNQMVHHGQTASMLISPTGGTTNLVGANGARFPPSTQQAVFI